ncbi:MAG: PHP domain-containing protein [Candidatus Delongbacteria bacterium]|nr:PHP domain-containing protein [Candidatus Delongbacteria bacterium]
MSLIVYSQYTKPEGSIKFDDLVIAAKKNGVKTLALTDHGNFSGITEFYSKCLDFGIKPIIGLDFFCMLKNKKFVRVILYIKNFTGYRNVLGVVEKLRYNSPYYFCGIDELTNIRDCYLCISLYKTDIHSQSVEIETDLNYIQGQFEAVGTDKELTFYHILADDDDYNRSISETIMKFSTEKGIKLLGCNPVYYIGSGSHKIKDFFAALSGYKSHSRQFREQFLRNEEYLKDVFPEQAVDNYYSVIKGCHFLIEDLPVRFPDLKLKTKIEYSCFYTLKNEIRKKTGGESDIVQKIIDEELAFVRNYNIADIILFLIEFRDEYYARYGKKIFFSGFVNDLHIAYILNMTLSSPIFASFDYHRAVLANKKIHPQITVVVSPEGRSDLFEYLSERFPEDSICFLSEYAKWHFPSVLAFMEKQYGLEKRISDQLIKYYTNSNRSGGKLSAILDYPEITALTNDNSEIKELIENAVKADETFKNYNTNTNQLVISNDKVNLILPVIKKDTDSVINTSFYNMNTARHFGVWSINIESASYLDVRSHFELGPLDFSCIEKESGSLISKIKSDDLDLIPYFSYSHERIKYLDSGKSSVWNLILYHESFHSNLSFIHNRPSPEPPKNRFSKDLEVTRGFIVFREQLYYICDRLFGSKDIVRLKHRLSNSNSYIQFNSVLNQISVNDKFAEACEYLRSAVQPTVFYLSFPVALTKLTIALRILDLKMNRYSDLLTFTFTREVNLNGDWRKYIPGIVSSGFIFNKFTIGDTVRQLKRRGKSITLPFYCLRGISVKVSDHLFEFVSTNMLLTFQEFLERSDREFIKRNIVEILVKTGYFDIFNSNRKELNILSERYFKSLKSEDDQPELFESDSIEIGSEDSVEDYNIEEKKRFEDEYSGLIFTAPNGKACEMCRLIRNIGDTVTENDPGIYENNDFILHISLKTNESSLFSTVSDNMCDEGNCEVVVFFSDKMESVRLDRYITINDLMIYRLKYLLKNVPYYIEIKK